MKASQFQAIVRAREQGKQGRNKDRPRGSNKYSAERTTLDGHKFDSKAEARRYATLRQMERAGLIRDLRLQEAYHLQGHDGPLFSEAGRPLIYKADFVYIDVTDGQEVIEDVKGMKTQAYRLKKALMVQMGKPITEVSVR
ncbi:DUF1064 domain-containing protein [Roseovarius nitratireducens]|uniref:DUF1064 domain-containing protein n=1 Tax=Roseovarius nitratireducens TaxID=2044597 RepID=UPI000CE19AE3|nr:DUF1064 domain-containing protein [Roseovarius nitratireducens]